MNSTLYFRLPILVKKMPMVTEKVTHVTMTLTMTEFPIRPIIVPWYQILISLILKLMVMTNVVMLVTIVLYYLILIKKMLMGMVKGMDVTLTWTMTES